MPNIFFWIALGIALLDWVAVAKQWKTLEYFAKPGVMVALLLSLWSTGGLSGPLLWFALGLFFSMWGDIFLMLPREQFIAGLVAFLLGHIAYLIGFNQPLPPLNLPGLILAVMVGLTAARLARAIVAGLLRSGNASLRLPVLAYSAVISLMLLSALLTLVRPDWDSGDALLASAGAMLFFISVSVLAWNKFVTPLPNGRLLVIITYHLGQALIALGAARHLL